MMLGSGHMLVLCELNNSDGVLLFWMFSLYSRCLLSTDAGMLAVT